MCPSNHSFFPSLTPGSSTSISDTIHTSYILDCFLQTYRTTASTFAKLLINRSVLSRCRLGIIQPLLTITSCLTNSYRQMSVPSTGPITSSNESITTEQFEEVVEGAASMRFSTNELVFYNKIQVLNRDLSVQVIRLFSETLQKERDARVADKLARFERDGGERAPFPAVQGITVLDALAASGLRSVRYLKEIPNVRRVTINDLDAAATTKASENVNRNGVSDRADIHTGDATSLMYAHREPLLNFDVIDLDPYGTASPFLDAAVQAVSDGGLLCVTCTDMTVLSGNFPEVCYSKYGAIPLKARYTHETALRILLHSIDCAANRYKRHIEPWISMSIDYYIRVFVRIHERPAEVKRSVVKTAYILQSSQCPSFWLQPVGQERANNFAPAPFTCPSVCEDTGGKLLIGGPIWCAPIHRQNIVDEVLHRVEQSDSDAYPPATAKRLRGLLQAMSEELKDVPLFYYLPDLASAVHSKVPSVLDVHSALVNAGYQVSQFHHEPHAVKTNAPANVVWDVMRAFCKLNPPLGSKHRKNNSVADTILSKPITTNIDFTPVHSVLQSRALDVARFPPNPEENWGPKSKAGKKTKVNSEEAGVSKKSKVCVDSAEDL